MLNAKSALPSRYLCTCSLHLDTNATKCVCPSTTNQGRMMILNCSLPYLESRTTPSDSESNRAFVPTRIPAPAAVIEESYQPRGDASRREHRTSPFTRPPTDSQSAAVRNVTAPAATSGTEESDQPTAGHGQDAIRNITASSDNEEIVRARRAVLEHLHRSAVDSTNTNTSSNSSATPSEPSCYTPHVCKCSCSSHGRLEVVCDCETMVQWYCAIRNSTEVDPATTAAPSMIACSFICKFSIVLGQYVEYYTHDF